MPQTQQGLRHSVASDRKTQKVSFAHRRNDTNLADRLQLCASNPAGSYLHELDFLPAKFPDSSCWPVVARVDFYQSDTQRLIAATGVKQAQTCECSL